jgi:hypothetical protein
MNTPQPQTLSDFKSTFLDAQTQSANLFLKLTEEIIDLNAKMKELEKENAELKAKPHE